MKKLFELAENENIDVIEKKLPDNCKDVLGLFLFELFEGQVKKTDLYHK